MTRVLFRLREGDLQAAEELFAIVHDELRRLAGAKMRGARRGHTLQATALVNEAYIRLLGEGAASWENRSHFFSAAARAMRSILVDYARRRGAEKRGGDRARRVPLDLEDRDEAGLALEEMVSVHEALEKLEQLDARKCRVVELLYWVGLDFEDAAKLLEISVATAKRDWRFARAWLLGEMTR